VQTVVLLLVGAFILGGTRFGRWARDRPPVLLPLCVLAAGSFYSLSIIL
jgi:hypothetical protein